MSSEEKYDTEVECDHCGKVKMCTKDCDPFVLEVYEERTEESYWCEDCLNDRKDEV